MTSKFNRTLLSTLLPSTTPEYDEEEEEYEEDEEEDEDDELLDDSIMTTTMESDTTEMNPLEKIEAKIKERFGSEIFVLGFFNENHFSSKIIFSIFT